MFFECEQSVKRVKVDASYEMGQQANKQAIFNTKMK